MSDEKDSYELSPIDADRPVTPPVVAPPGVPGGAVPSPASRPLTLPSPPGYKGALLDDFDEDADFSRDPEVERALKGVRGAIAGQARPGDTREVFIKPGFGAPQAWWIVGAVLLVGAVIAAAVNNTPHPVVAPLLVLYSAFLHTGTGLVALAVASVLVHRRLGPLTLPGARMFVAVTAFLLVLNLRITLLGAPELLWEEWTLSSLAYVAAVAGLFRLWGRALGYVVCSHFLLWVIVQIGMELSVWVRKT